MSTRVYIGHLPYGVRERDLEDFFHRFLPIRDVLIKDHYAFVEFDNPRDADDAAYYMDGKKLCGERVTVELARRPPKGRDVYRTSGTRYLAQEYEQRRDPYYSLSSNRSPEHRQSSRTSFSRPTRWRIRVENLSTGVSWQDLKDFMRQVGEVTYADAHSDYEREGVVSFTSERDMFRALDRLDGANLNGRRIRLVDESRSRSTSYSRSPSRSRSRSRSKSYSRSRTRSGTYSRSRTPSPTPNRERSLSRERSESRSASDGEERGRGRSRSSSLSAPSKRSDNK